MEDLQELPLAEVAVEQACRFGPCGEGFELGLEGSVVSVV
jgi:hypothetical protein